jgi:16S rRNA (cytosine967-C5)-methyltransferase
LVAKSGARAVAADVVARVLDDGAWTQPALASALSSSPLDARDRALCTELVYGTLRWATSLEKSLLRGADKPQRGLDKRMRPHLLVAAYQLQHLSERIPARAAVNEAVDAVRVVRPGLEGFANALLRKLGSPVHAMLPADAKLDVVADALGIPHALANAVASIERTLPIPDVRAALAGLNARPSTYAFALDESRESANAHAFVPGAFALDGGAVTDAPGFAQGSFVVVDPGSAVAALCVAATPGARVIDLCAAPGGKSAILARAVGAAGRVTCVEKSAKRAERIRENLARVKLAERVDVVVADVLAWNAASVKDRADAVLLDAPCTGFGTTRRKPEIKLRRTDADVDVDSALQAKLLARAADLVKPGGALVYSVCSPLDAEGAKQIDALLAARADFAVDDVRALCPWLPSDAVDARGFVRLLPHRHDCDAFFVARLVRSR